MSYIIATLLYIVLGAGIQKTFQKIPSEDAKIISDDSLALFLWPFILVWMAFNPDSVVGKLEPPSEEQE